MPKNYNRAYDETTGKTISQRDKEEAHDYRYFSEPDIPPMEFEQEYLDGIKNSLPELPTETKKRLIATYGIKEDFAKILVDVCGYEMVEKFEALVQQNLDANKVLNLLLNRKDYQNLDIEEFVKKFDGDSSTLSDESYLKDIVLKVISENTKAVEDYKGGKEASFQFLLGKIMRETNGRADVSVVKELLLNSLS